MRGFLKYIVLFIIACVGAIAIYYAVVPEENRIPFSIEINNKK